MKKKIIVPESKKTPIRAIREYCLECSGGSNVEVKLCALERCPLYAFRFGVRPATAAKRFASQGNDVIKKSAL